MSIINTLPSACFVPYKMRRIANADVLYVNFDLFHQYGLLNDTAEITPEVRKFILDHFAYARPTEGHEVSDFLLSEERTFYAERYGGGGIMSHGGGARAALFDRFQIKGCGPNPLLGKTKDFSHKHGSMTLEEAIRETIFSELAHHALPFGGSRVFAILTTRSPAWHYIAHEDRVMGVPRALIVRESKARPANFLRAASFKPRAGILSDAERVRAAMSALMENLPEAPGSEALAAEEDFPRRFKQMVCNAAEQSAAAKVKRIFHGSITPSNVLLNGGWVDFGTASVVPGYDQFITTDHQPAYWNDVFSSFGCAADLHGAIVRYGSESQKQSLASVDYYRSYFKDTFDRALHREFVQSIGVDDALLDQLPEVVWRPVGALMESIARIEDPVERKTNIIMNNRPWGPQLAGCIREHLSAALFGRPEPSLKWGWNVECFRHRFWKALSSLIAESRMVAERLGRTPAAFAKDALLKFEKTMRDKPELNRIAMTGGAFGPLVHGNDSEGFVREFALSELHAGLAGVAKHYSMAS
jgi:hypothetical protein